MNMAKTSAKKMTTFVKKRGTKRTKGKERMGKNKRKEEENGKKTDFDFQEKPPKKAISKYMKKELEIWRKTFLTNFKKSIDIFQKSCIILSVAANAVANARVAELADAHV